MIYVWGDSFAADDPESKIKPWHEQLTCTNLARTGATNTQISQQVDHALENASFIVVLLFSFLELLQMSIHSDWFHLGIRSQSTSSAGTSSVRTSSARQFHPRDFIPHAWQGLRQGSVGRILKLGRCSGREHNLTICLWRKTQFLRTEYLSLYT